MDSTPSEISPSQIPIIDVGPLVRGDSSVVAREIGRACRVNGFFYVVGHGVDTELSERLRCFSARFFALDLEDKMRIRMERGGRAWRGFFPVGAELTKGEPDAKEGLYFGAELGPDHEAVVAGRPMHGANQFPDEERFPDLEGFRETVLEHMAAMTELGHLLVQGIAISLGLSPSYFADRYTRDPFLLFRIFHYPPLQGSGSWSVGEHTDYGLLTILQQDSVRGLEVKSGGTWIDAPPVDGAFVCNIGDMLDRMTGGFYRSTAHRVRNASSLGRLSFPFFFDPNFDAAIRPIDPTAEIVDDQQERWDGASVHDFEGTYGDYILRKVGRVFPDLGRDIS